jgi:hypothetical protein
VKTGLVLGLSNTRVGGYLFHYLLPFGVNLHIASSTPRPF